jgi:hypothetical protein
MKKTVALVMAILLLFAIMPSAAFAEEAVQDGAEQQVVETQEAASSEVPADKAVTAEETEAPTGQAVPETPEEEGIPAEQSVSESPVKQETAAEEPDSDPQNVTEEGSQQAEEDKVLQETALPEADAETAAEQEELVQPEFEASLEKYGSLWLAEVYFTDVDMSLWTSLTLKITKGSTVVGEYRLAYTPEEMFGAGVYSDSLLCELIEEGIWQAVKQIPDNTDMKGTVLTAIAVVDGVEYTRTVNAVGEGKFNSSIVPIFSDPYLEESKTGWEAGFDFENVNLSNWIGTSIEIYDENGLVGEYALVTPPEELFGKDGYFTGSLSFDFNDDENWEAITPIPDGYDFTGTIMVAFTIAEDIITTLYAEAMPLPEFSNAYLARPTESGGNDWSAGVDFKDVDLRKWTKTTFRVQKGDEVIGEYELKTAPSALYGTDGVYSGTLSCGLFADEHWDAVKQVRDTQDMSGTKLVVTAEIGGNTYTVEAAVTGEGTFGKIPELSNAYLTKPAESGGNDWNAGVDFKDVRLSRWTNTTFRVVKDDEVIGEYTLKTLPSELYGTTGVFSGTLSCELFADEHWNAVKQIKDISDLAGSELVVTVVIDGETYTAQADTIGEGTFGKIPEVFNAYLAKPTADGWNAGVDFKDVRLSRWTNTTFRVVKGDEVIGEYTLKTLPSELYGTAGIFSGTLSSGLVGDEHWTVVKQIPGNTDMTGTKLVVTAVIDGETYTAEAAVLGEGEFVNVPYFTNAYLAMPNEAGWNAGVDFNNADLSKWTKTTFKVLKGEKVIGEYTLTAAPAAIYGTNGRFSGTLSSGLVQDAYWKAVRQIPGGTDMTGTCLVVTAVVDGVTYTVSANAIGGGKFVNIPEVVTAPPKTGDDSKALIGLMLMLSGLMLAAAVLRNRREQAGC